MWIRLSVVACALVAGACSAEDDGSAPPPGSTNPPGGPPVLAGTTPGGEAARIFALVRDRHEAELDRLVGRYARGEAPIYRGTAQAFGNASMLSGPVVASLVKSDQVYWQNRQTTGFQLTIFSSAQQRRFRVTQVPEAPGTTRADMVVPYNSSFGVTAACTDCVPGLAALPAALAFDLRATGQYYDGRPLNISASGSLSQVPPEALDFHLLWEVNQLYDGATVAGIAAFQPRGDEMVRVVDGEWYEKTERPPSVAYDSCRKITRYRVEQYVNSAHVVDFGLRNPEVVEQKTCCSDSNYPGCGPPPTVCI